MSSHSRSQTVSDALLDVQQNPNRHSGIKRFGVVMVIMLLLCSVLLPYRLSLAIAAALLALCTVLYPPILYPLYGVLSPPLNLGLKLFLAIGFYGMVCPVAFLARIVGIDIMQQQIQPEAQSYWIKRSLREPHGKSMISQR